MTARQIWEGLLTDLNKVNAPSILLLDFNYFLNKAINLYINKRYNLYDTNLLLADDLRVLKTTAILNNPTIVNKYDVGSSNIFGDIYEVVFPDDYLHILNCICIYKLTKNHKCYSKDSYAEFAAKRLTADAWPEILSNYYNRPLPLRPYYYLHNINQAADLPTNEYSKDIPGSTDQVWTGTEDTGFKALSEFPRIVRLGSKTTTMLLPLIVSLAENVPGLRHINPSKVRCEIRCGHSTEFVLEKIFIDYIKAPQKINLTLDLLDLVADTSLIIEFPDNICHEIINELVSLVMENIADPRLQSHSIVTQSIANPVQQLAPQLQPRRGY